MKRSCKHLISNLTHFHYLQNKIDRLWQQTAAWCDSRQIGLVSFNHERGEQVTPNHSFYQTTTKLFSATDCFPQLTLENTDQELTDLMMEDCIL